MEIHVQAFGKFDAGVKLSFDPATIKKELGLLAIVRMENHECSLWATSIYE